eukprot:scaffold7026_cov65-Phaeocystis_antarctica.AAC.8
MNTPPASATNAECHAPALTCQGQDWDSLRFTCTTTVPLSPGTCLGSRLPSRPPSPRPSPSLPEPPEPHAHTPPCAERKSELGFGLGLGLGLGLRLGLGRGLGLLGLGSGLGLGLVQPARRGRACAARRTRGASTAPPATR